MERIEQDEDVPTEKIDFANALLTTAIGLILSASEDDEQEGIAVVLTSLQHTLAKFLVSLKPSFKEGCEEEAFTEGLDIIDSNIRAMVADLRRRGEFDGVTAQ